jgi:SNF2 family DNA or RNA helicase
MTFARRGAGRCWGREVVTTVLAKVYVELIDGQIAAFTEYHPETVANFKSIGGASWHPKDKSWRYSTSMEVCRALRSVFGDALVIGPELNAWARVAKVHDEKMSELVGADDAEVKYAKVFSPPLAKAMSSRKYQRVGAQFIARGRRVLIADEPGLGKTLETIAGLMEGELWWGPVLVVAPLTSLRTVWEYELKRWTDAVATVAVPRERDSHWARAKLIDEWLENFANDTEVRPHILIVNPEMVRDAHKKFPLLLDVPWNAVVVDESHRYLAGIRSRSDKTQTGEALTNLKIADGGVKVALSGTPMRGRPSNLWGTLHWLEPQQYTSYYSWARRYFDVSSNRYSQFIVGPIRRDREALLYESLDKIMLRRTKSEVLSELPPKQHLDVWCEMGAEQARQYKQMMTRAMAELEDETLKPIGILAIMTRLKQMANGTVRIQDEKVRPNMRPETSGKTAVIEQMLIERGIAGKEREGEDKIVIASQFTQTINSLGEWLASIDVPFMKITGEVKESERVDVTETFQRAGGPRVLLMNTKAGGVSITLDAFCDELIIVDETWNPDDQIQLEDRIHRASRIHQVMIYQLMTKGTIDEYIKATTSEKFSVTSRLLDERRGVEVAKMLVKGSE